MFMLASSWMVLPLAVLFVIICVVMMLVILIQKPKGGGLSGAFGGAGGGANDAFGAKTGDVLTWFTVGCFVAFLLLAMGLTWTITPDVEEPVFDFMPAGQTTSDTTDPAATLGGDDTTQPEPANQSTDQRIDGAVPDTRDNTAEVDQFLQDAPAGN